MSRTINCWFIRCPFLFFSSCERQLYKRLCLSIHLSVHPSVRPSILQDFIPYRGRCPASPQENQGESRAGQGNRWPFDAFGLLISMSLQFLSISSSPFPITSFLLFISQFPFKAFPPFALCAPPPKPSFKFLSTLPSLYSLYRFFFCFLGSGPNSGWSPVEWGDFRYVCSFVHLFVCSSIHPSPPLGHPARPEAQTSRPEAQPARPEA